MAELFDLTVNMVTMVSGLSCALSVLPSAHLFSMWLLVYLQLCLVMICWTRLFCTQIYSQPENYLKTGRTRGRNTVIIWEARTVECSRASFQICLPCQEKALLQWQPRGVCYNTKFIWDAKLKSQSQVKNQGTRGVHTQNCSFLPAY